MQKGMKKIVDAVEPVWCKHCDDRDMRGNHIAIEDDCFQWCIDCAAANGMITQKEYDAFEKENKELYREYLKRELENLNNE